MIHEAELWAQDGINELLTDDIRATEGELSREVVYALLRAAYGVGYVRAGEHPDGAAEAHVERCKAMNCSLWLTLPTP